MSTGSKIILWFATAALAAITVWRVDVQPRAKLILGQQGEVTWVTFSPDGRHIASGVLFSGMHVADTATGKEMFRIPLYESGDVMAFLPDGKTLAVIQTWVPPYKPGEIAFIEMGSGKTLNQIHAEAGIVRRIAVSPDGKRLASLSFDGWLRIFDLATAKELLQMRFGSPPAHAHALCFSPDGRLVAFDVGYSVWLCDSVSGQHIRTFEGHTNVTDGATTYSGHIQDIVFSPDGSYLVSASIDHTLRIWATATGETRHVLRGHVGPVQAVALVQHGEIVLSGGDDGTIRSWELATGRPLRTVRAHESVTTGLFRGQQEVFSLAVSPDGKMVASGGRDATVRLWMTDELVAGR